MEMFESKATILSNYGTVDAIKWDVNLLVGYNPKVICNDCGCPVTPPTMNAGMLHIHSCGCSSKEITNVDDVPDDIVEEIEEKHCELTVRNYRCAIHTSVNDSIDQAFDSVLDGVFSNKVIQEFKDIIHGGLDSDIDEF